MINCNINAVAYNSVPVKLTIKPLTKKKGVLTIKPTTPTKGKTTPKYWASESIKPAINNKKKEIQTKRSRKEWPLSFLSSAITKNQS